MFEHMCDNPWVAEVEVLNRAERIASAQASGTAERCTWHRRISREEALAQIARILEPVQPGRRRLVLSNAAAAYVQTGDDRYAYQVACAELLRDAGADLDLAARIWLRRHPTGQPPIGIVHPQ